MVLWDPVSIYPKFPGSLGNFKLLLTTTHTHVYIQRPTSGIESSILRTGGLSDDIFLRFVSSYDTKRFQCFVLSSERDFVSDAGDG